MLNRIVGFILKNPILAVLLAVLLLAVSIWALLRLFFFRQKRLIQRDEDISVDHNHQKPVQAVLNQEGAEPSLKKENQFTAQSVGGAASTQPAVFSSPPVQAQNSSDQKTSAVQPARRPALSVAPPVYESRIVFHSSWDLYVYSLKKNKWWLILILIVVSSAVYLFLSAQAPIYEATTRIMVHQKPGVKYVANTYQAEQASNTMSTTLVQIVLSDDFETKVLNSLLDKNPNLYPVDLLARLENNKWLEFILNKNGLIDGNYIRRLPVVTIFTLGTTKAQAVEIGKLATDEIINQSHQIYGGVDSLDLRLIDKTKVLNNDPIFPKIKETLLFIFVFVLALELFISYIISETRFYHYR